MSNKSLFNLLNSATNMQADQEIETEPVHPIEDLRRELLKPKYEPLYGKQSILETLEGLGRQMKPQNEKGNDALLQKMKRDQENAFLTREPPSVEYLRSSADLIRKILGLDNVVKLEGVKDTLLSLGAKSSSDEGIFAIVYPFLLTEVAKVRVWEVGRVYFTPESHKLTPIMYLYSVINTYADLLNCHPVVALGFLLCDAPINREDILIIIEGSRIEIVVNHPEASAEAVRKLYSLVRNSMIREMREVRGKWARPRSSTRRIVALGKFVIDNPNLSWEELVKKWNAEHPGWEYKNVNSMAAAYSRLKGRMRKGTGFVKYWFADSSGI